jgi:hypothetical protein
LHFYSQIAIPDLGSSIIFNLQSNIIEKLSADNKNGTEKILAGDGCVHLAVRGKSTIGRAQRIPAAQSHLLRWCSATMYHIACVAPPCICPCGARNVDYCTFATGC